MTNDDPVGGLANSGPRERREMVEDEAGRVSDIGEALRLLSDVTQFLHRERYSIYTGVEDHDRHDKAVYQNMVERCEKVRQSLERQRDENQTLRGLLDAVLSASESEREVRRIAAKHGIVTAYATAPDPDDDYGPDDDVDVQTRAEGDDG